MQIDVLASSSAGNCYAVSDGQTRLLLDPGIRYVDIRKGLWAATGGFGVSGLAGCLVTHEHQDHAKSVRDILKAGVDCYMSSGTAEALGITRHHRVRPVEAMEQFRIGTWTCRAFDAVHDAAEPLGFLLASGAEKLLYLTDSAYCRYRFEGLTHLLVECNHSWRILRENVANGTLDLGLKNRILRNHMSLETLLEFLKANDMSRVQRIVLLHLSDSNSNEAEFKAAVQAATGRPVYVARA